MFRTLLLSVTVSAALLFAAAPAQAQSPSTIATVLKVARKLPWEDVISLLDDLGPGKTKPKVKARVRSLLPQMRLCVYSAKVDVTVSDYSPGRLGKIEMELSMPADVDYIVDLRSLEPQHLKWDAKRKILRVKLPPVAVGNVCPRLDEEEVTTRFTGMRYYWFNAAARANLERKLRREDYRPAAREEAEKRLSDAVRAGRDQVKLLLKKLLVPATSDIEVIVE
jgi:hypothetical protein